MVVQGTLYHPIISIRQPVMQQTACLSGQCDVVEAVSLVVPGGSLSSRLRVPVMPRLSMGFGMRAAPPARREMGLQWRRDPTGQWQQVGQRPGTTQALSSSR